MKITRVEAIPLFATWERVYGPENVPADLLHPAAHFGTFPRRGQFSTLVFLEIESGQIGIGEAWGLPLPQLPAQIVNEHLRPFLLGRDAREIEAIWDAIYRMAASLGHTRGPMMEALSGVDIALWDLRGQLENQPIAALLAAQFGAAPRPQVPCYVSPVRFCQTPQQSADLAGEFVSQGFGALKIKCGRDPQTDVLHLKAIRARVGNKIRLMTDFNCAYDAPQTLEFADLARDLGLEWLEEPLPSDQIAAMAELKKQVKIPLAGGENEFSPTAFEDLLARGALDIVQPNISRAGGFTGVSRIARSAQNHGAQLSLHGVGATLTICASLHAMSALPGASWFEANRFPNALRETLALPAPCPCDGFFEVPSGPGLGVEVDERVVARFGA